MFRVQALGFSGQAMYLLKNGFVFNMLVVLALFKQSGLL